MKTSQRFKDGARDAWTFIVRGQDLQTITKLAENHADPYVQGWAAQCEDPDTELHPPDYREPDDGDAFVGIMIALGLTAFAAFAVLALVGVYQPAGWALLLSFLTVSRIARTKTRR